MPFILDESDVAWPLPDDGPDGQSDFTEQFRYLTPSQWWRGIHEPVHFRVLPLADTQAALRAAGLIRERASGLWTRLLFWRNRVPQSTETNDRNYQETGEYLFALMIPVFRQCGIERVYCRYDGGNDEGFSWFDHGQRSNGERVDEDELIQMLLGTSILRRAHDDGIVLENLTHLSPTDQLRDILNNQLPAEWASMLLCSYGTGPHLIYGAFTADLVAQTLVDDPAAEAIFQNVVL